MIKFCLFLCILVFQIFQAAAGILCPLLVRSVYSVCKLYHPQAPESKANQEEEWRLATCLWPQRTTILLTSDSTDRTPSKSSLVTCAIKAICHKYGNLAALGRVESTTVTSRLCVCSACNVCVARQCR